ncbi:MAG: LacI family DNA-binding transcriptional regulator [Chitinophagaceae bacterium]|nr:LacI family DNA-binding transcriptional regulator [Anaerolineae bacterium]
MKRLTLEEVAKLAGVSRATVSRVVNDYPHIKPEVRERVQEIIAKTGFQLNGIARSLASNRSGIVGLIIPSAPRMVFSDPFFPTLIHGITQAINRNNLTLCLFLFHSKEEENRTIRSILNTRLLDGLIITADRKEESFMPQLMQHEMPVVLIGRPATSAAINYVDTDNITGGYLATEHLIKLGHRRIAMIGTNENTASDDRLEGYRKALHDYDYVEDPALIAFGDYSMQSGYEAMQLILKGKPDAIFVASDTMALGALRAIREAGLRVPDDIALVGFDDLDPALQADPPLTTIRHPIEQLGVIAVDTLSRILIGEGKPPSSTILPVSLIIRASCGAQYRKFLDIDLNHKEVSGN